MITLDEQQENALKGLAGAIGFPIAIHALWLKGMARVLLSAWRWRDRRGFDVWDKLRIQTYARRDS